MASLFLTTLLALVCAGTIPAETINAAGATFPAPIYQRWFEQFHNLHAEAKINYQSMGSGAGIRQLMEGTMDFGASDMPMTDQQLARFRNFKVLHFPTVAGGVVPGYNIPQLKGPIRFTSQTLAGIYLGTILKWNDPLLQKDNPDVRFPDAEITVVHRSDGSGTTFVWTDYLSKLSPEWKSKVGAGTSVNWPRGLGAKGNEGVSGLVKQTPNSIGYIDLIYAVHNNMAYGLVRNAAGTFVRADFESVTEAAASAAKDMPEDFRVSITNAPGLNAYPISTFTWLLIPNRIEDAAKRTVIKAFLVWMLEQGQQQVAAMSYAPLPELVVARERKQIAGIQ